MAIQAPPERPVEHRRREEMALRNVGGAERTTRLVVGLILIAFGYGASATAWLSGLLYALGVVILLTALASYCPVNAAIGRNSYYRSGMS